MVHFLEQHLTFPERRRQFPRSILNTRLQLAVQVLQLSHQSVSFALGTLAFRDVDDRAENEVTVRRRKRIEADLDRKLGPIFPHAVELAPRPHRASLRVLEEVGAMLRMSLSEPLGHEELHGFAE